MNRIRRVGLIGLLALLVSACLPASPPGGGILTVAVLDIGQGDSILIRSPNGQTMLIDGGN